MTEENSDVKISARQLMTLLIVSKLVDLVYFKQSYGDVSARECAISALLSCALLLLFGLGINAFIRRMNHTRKKYRLFLESVCAAYLLISTYYQIISLHGFLVKFSDKPMAPFIIFVIIAAVIFITVTNGLESIGRISSIILFVCGFLFVLMLILNRSNVQLTNIATDAGLSFENILRITAFETIACPEIAVFLLLSDSVGNPPKTQHAFRGFAVSKSFVIIAASVVVEAIMSGFSGLLKYPFVYLSMTFGKRAEAIFILVFIAAVCVKLCIYSVVITRAIVKRFERSLRNRIILYFSIFLALSTLALEVSNTSSDGLMVLKLFAAVCVAALWLVIMLIGGKYENN